MFYVFVFCSRLAASAVMPAFACSQVYTNTLLVTYCGVPKTSKQIDPGRNLRFATVHRVHPKQKTNKSTLNDVGENSNYCFVLARQQARGERPLTPRVPSVPYASTNPGGRFNHIIVTSIPGRITARTFFVNYSDKTKKCGQQENAL